MIFSSIGIMSLPMNTAGVYGGVCSIYLNHGCDRIWLMLKRKVGSGFKIFASKSWQGSEMYSGNLYSALIIFW